MTSQYPPKSIYQLANMNLAYILIALLAAAIVVAFFIGRQVAKSQYQIIQLQQQIEYLHQKADDTQGEVNALVERLNGRPMSNRAIAGVEDMTAHLIELEVQAEIFTAHLQNMRDITSILRNRPHEYDQDKPSTIRRQA